MSKVQLVCRSEIESEFPPCSNCFHRVSSIISGLLWMSIRFCWSLEPVFGHIDKVVSVVSEGNRVALYSSVWEMLASEAVELQELAEDGEDWAEEGVKVVYRAIRQFGLRMCEKAYGRKPVSITVVSEE